MATFVIIWSSNIMFLLTKCLVNNVTCTTIDTGGTTDCTWVEYSTEQELVDSLVFDALTDRC